MVVEDLSFTFESKKLFYFYFTNMFWGYPISKNVANNAKVVVFIDYFVKYHPNQFFDT